MSNETIGLTVKIDGDISSGKKKVDELAAYAKQVLGNAFSPKPGTGGQQSSTAAFARDMKSAEAAAKSSIQSIIDSAKSLRTDISASVAAGVGKAANEIESLRSAVDGLRKEFKSAYAANSSGARDASRDVSAFRTQISGLERDLKKLEGQNKTANYQRYGMFNNKGISPIFTAQQIVEDYSYAGMRGAANNIAFLLAELAPAGGVGMGLAGGGILALMTYQFYEMGKSMKWWGGEASKAAEDAKRLTQNLGTLSGSLMSIRLASADMSGQGAALNFSSAFMGQRGAGFVDMRNSALSAMVRGPMGRRLLGAVASSAASNPGAYTGVAGLGIPARDANARKRAYLSQLAGLQMSLATATGAAGSMPSAGVGASNPLTYFEDFGGTAWDLLAGKEDALSSRPQRNQDAKRKLIESLMSAGSPGVRIADRISGMDPSKIDYTSIVKELNNEVLKLKDSFNELNDTQREAMSEIKNNSEDAAKSILTAAKSNNAVADSVQDVIERNRELSDEYKRQMDILKNIEVLRERDNFRSSAFALMRSKGSQFLEEAGAPRWLIEQRNRGLYERQAGFLYGSAQASGAAGDIRGQIDYLKQIQQLQFEVIGNTDNRNIAERVMERAIVLQHEIEALIRTNQQQGQAEYEMVQQLTGGLIQMREILNSMPKINLGALQQAGEVAQLNAQLAALRANAGGGIANGAAALPNPATTLGSMPRFNKGGHIPGYGGGDKVPALLEKGEFVINKNAVRTLGVDTMHEINAAGNVRKFAKGGWSGTGYGMVYSTYPGQRERARRLRSGQAWSRDFRGESASAWARRGVLSIRDQEERARQSERSWMAMYGRAAGQIGNWGSYGDTGIEATLGSPGGAAASRGRAGMFGGAIGSLPGVSLKRSGPMISGTFNRDVYSGTDFAQMLGADGSYSGSLDSFRDLVRYPTLARIRDNGGTIMRGDPNGTFSWNGINQLSPRDFMAHMRQRNGGMLNVNWGRTVTLPGGREVNTQYGQAGQGWMQMRMAQRQATASLMSERARQAQAAASASKLRYARQAHAISNAGANRRAVGAFYASRNGMTPQQVYQMRMSRLYGGRWGGNFNNYVGQLFGGGFSPFMGGGFPQMGGGTGWGNSYGLYDSGPALMGLRAFARGGYVTKDGGRLISLNPDVFQDDTDWEFMGGYPSNGPDMNYMSFMDQRNRVLAGSYNRSDLGAMDFAGNQLGSFGQFSDGSYRSRYSGGFSSVGRGQGFSSGMGGRGFSSFGRPIGAMTGGFITQGAGIQRFATGGLVRGGTTTSSSSTVNNNFGTVRIEVKSPKDAADATTQMRRSKSSYWAQKG